MPRFSLPFICGLLCTSFVLPAAADVSLDPALRILLNQEAGQIPGVLRTLQSPGSSSALPRFTRSAFSGAQEDVVEVFVRAQDRPGVDGLHRVSGDLYAGRIPISALRRLVEEESILGARLSRPVRFTMDKSMSYLGMDRLRTVDPGTDELDGLTGKGVLVGIVDGGLDASHPDLRTPEGGTRITRYWDQWWDNRGSNPSGYFFGTEYKAQQINDRLESVVDLSGHGTHVAGVAVGNGRSASEGTPFLGIAPEAGIIGVRTTFTEVGVILGAQYVFERADFLGLPAVINLSLGNHYGPHVGDTDFESALDELVGPGRLIVAAAGNEGHQDIHAEMTLQPGESALLTVQVPAYDKDINNFAFLSFEGWFDLSNRYRFTVISPQGEEMGSLVYRNLEREFVGARGIARGWYTGDHGWGSLLLEIEDNYKSNRLATGEWKVRVEALEVNGDPELDFWLIQWNGFRDNVLPRFSSFVDREETVISPSTAQHILSVGAMSTRACWPNQTGTESCYADPPEIGTVAYFSSRGPTADGRDKPEILAPGFGVVSALSAQISPLVLSEEKRAQRTTPDGRYWINQGTSMSAPHVAGTAALLLQRYPTMTFEQMRDRLVSRGTRIQDSRSGKAIPSLQSGEALMPGVTLALSEIAAEPEGVRLRWFTGKEREAVRYRVFKGFDPQGPYFALSSRGISGKNPFTLFDQNLDPGRKHYYRIVAENLLGLTDELDTLSVEVEGALRPIFRSPDPNPGRTGIHLRYFLPRSSGGGQFEVDVFDLQGRHINRVDHGSFGPSGMDGESTWNLLHQGGSRVGAGVYFVSLRYRYQGGSSHSQVHRVVVLP